MLLPNKHDMSRACTEPITPDRQPSLTRTCLKTSDPRHLSQQRIHISGLFRERRPRSHQAAFLETCFWKCHHTRPIGACPPSRAADTHSISNAAEFCRCTPAHPGPSTPTVEASTVHASGSGHPAGHMRIATRFDPNTRYLVQYQRPTSKSVLSRSPVVVEPSTIFAKIKSPLVSLYANAPL